MSGRRVLVTGGAGFVGSNLVRRLAREGHAVHLLVRPTATPTPDSGPDHAPWRLASVARELQCHAVALDDGEAVRRAVARIRPEWIFHLAAHGAYPWHTDRQAMIDTNITGTSNLLDACLRHGFAAFVHAGSSVEYGPVAHAPAESEPVAPMSDYAVTKAAATLLGVALARRHGAPIVTLRLYSVYGPDEDPRRLLPTLIAHARRGSLPPLVRPEIARDFVYVADVEDAFLLAAARPEPGAVYNIGTGVQTTLAELVQLVQQQFALTAEPVWGSMPDRAWDTTTWLADNRLARDRLGWLPRYSLDAGLRAMAAWLTDAGDPARLARYGTSPAGATGVPR